MFFGLLVSSSFFCFFEFYWFSLQDFEYVLFVFLVDGFHGYKGLPYRRIYAPKINNNVTCSFTGMCNRLQVGRICIVLIQQGLSGQVPVLIGMMCITSYFLIFTEYSRGLTLKTGLAMIGALSHLRTLVRTQNYLFSFNVPWK